MNIGSISATNPSQVTNATNKSAAQGVSNVTNNTTSTQSLPRAPQANQTHKPGGTQQVAASHDQVRAATAPPAATQPSSVNPSVNAHGQTVGQRINVTA